MRTLAILALALLAGSARAEEPAEDEPSAEEARKGLPGTVHNPIRVRVKLLEAERGEETQGKSLDDHWQSLTRSLLDLQNGLYRELDEADLDLRYRVNVREGMRVDLEVLRDEPEDRAVRVRVTDEKGAALPGIEGAWVETTSSPDKLPLAVASDGSVVVEHLSSDDTAVVSVQVQEDIVLIWIDESP